MVLLSIELMLNAVNINLIGFAAFSDFAESTRALGQVLVIFVITIAAGELALAIAIIFILSYDAILSFFQNGVFGVGVGTLILTINPILLAGYTFGCHAFRHLTGGNKDCFTCPNGKPTFRYKVWKGVSWLNGRHMMWAWISMIWVAFTDIYIRMVASGQWIDINTWNN